MGAPFTVVEWVEGAVVRDRDDLAALSDDDVQRTTAALVDVLVALHRVDVDAVGLRGLGRPGGVPRAAGPAVAPPVGPGPHPGTARPRAPARAARRRRALESAVAVVHGDYRIDNAILEPDRPAEVLAVVDWELSTLGDPLTDVALHVRLPAPGARHDPRHPRRLDQRPPAAGRGRSPSGTPADAGRDLGEWPFYLGLAHLKLAVIAEGIAHRAHAGADAGRDAARASEAVPELVAAGLAALDRRTPSPT